MKDLLLKNFIRISNIPRESGKESKIANFFINVAKVKKLSQLYVAEIIQSLMVVL